ncbi:MAG: 2-polyprenyl-3-methyl-5-hydroxy-6-metoxy-1,4-benzoquinol methylase [Pontimonas sp.]|jgi:2-polyprenyl-3-methyl-5-hydroxy-6-metoxy-1,4-benzoquinol methylase
MREVPLSAWKRELPDVTYLDGRLEDFPGLKGEFDSAVAIMVVEHVPDYPNLIGEVINHLRPGARAHFICPNYAFPYEPPLQYPGSIFKKVYGVLHWTPTRRKLQGHRGFSKLLG